MLLTEWNWDDALEVAREEAWEDGMERGRTEGLEITAFNALSKGISVQTVQEITGLEITTIEAIRTKL
jgi:hypothetical protein